MSEQSQLDLRILGFEPGDEIAGARKIMLRTSRGEIPMMMHAAKNPARAVLCVSGAIGGFDGPAMLYPRLGLELPVAEVGVLRLNYRIPNDFDECLIDALAALTFLKGVGYGRVALIGHSFGGAVAINAGTLSEAVTTVIAVSSQLAGAQVVANLKPRPLLLIHGTADTILPDECSKLLYRRASEPKTLKLFEGAGHRLNEVREELFTTVREWVLSKT
ncbi:MAG: alpha/beta hydrolase [Candidatus Binataceae bacterium]